MRKAIIVGALVLAVTYLWMGLGRKDLTASLCVPTMVTSQIYQRVCRWGSMAGSLGMLQM